MDRRDVSRWFDQYLAAFAACGRGERDATSLLAFYGVPLLLTTDAGAWALTSGDEIVAAVQPQLEGMRAGGYARTEVLDSEVTVVNSTSALYRATFSYHRVGGGELRRFTATYLVTGAAADPRISVLAVHSP